MSDARVRIVEAYRQAQVAFEALPGVEFVDFEGPRTPFYAPTDGYISDVGGHMTNLGMAVYAETKSGPALSIYGYVVIKGGKRRSFVLSFLLPLTKEGIADTIKASVDGFKNHVDP